MSQYDDVVQMNGILKTVYGKGVHQAVPDNVKTFFDLFPFSKGAERIGNTFAEAVNLQIEQGVTRIPAGTSGVTTLNNSVASQVQQASVNGAEIVMQAQMSWSLAAKARQPNSAQAFQNAMTQIVDNTLLSHRKNQVADMLYGGAPLATISSGTASATQTITNATCAPGIWYGNVGAQFDIYNPALGTKRNGSPLTLIGFSVSPAGTSRTLTFGASVTTTTNDVIVFSGTVSGAAVTTPTGLAAIASTQGGTLFGISQSTYPVFQGWTYAAGSTALSQKLLDEAVVNPMIAGYSGKMKLLCHPVSFSNLAQEQAGRIHLTQGLVRGTADVGYEKLRYDTCTGASLEIEGSPYVQEGTAWIVPMDGSVKRIGAVDVQLGGPDDPYPEWQKLPGAAGYYLISYSLQAMFTPEPWKLVQITGISNS